MTKLNFLYFILFIVPTLFVIRLRHAGPRRALAALIAFACWSAPSALYLVRWGRPAFDNAKASSFGRTANLFYYTPLLQYLGHTIRQSPGLVLSFVLMATALIYLLIKRRTILLGPDFMALLIVIVFGIIVLASGNRDIRYAFPAIVALPFLIAILMSGTGQSAPGRSAAFAAGLVFCGLFAAGVPTRHRPDRQSLSRCDAVLAQAARCNAKHVVLATDTATLNEELMDIALEVSALGASVKVTSLAYRAMSGVPIEEDFRAISESDQVVFQNRETLDPPFTNQRVSEYERYLQQGGYVPIRVSDDVSVYSLRCKP
jgi:hypothetical protein